MLFEQTRDFAVAHSKRQIGCRLGEILQRRMAVKVSGCDRHAVGSHLWPRVELEKVGFQSHSLRQLASATRSAGEVDEPLALEPPWLVGAEWHNGDLILTLNRPVNHKWISTLVNRMGSFSYSMNAPPQAFRFQGNIARVRAQEHEVQNIINHFKDWLPQVSRNLKHHLETEARRQEAEQLAQSKRERAAEEQHIRVNKSLRI